MRGTTGNAFFATTTRSRQSPLSGSKGLAEESCSDDFGYLRRAAQRSVHAFREGVAIGVSVAMLHVPELRYRHCHGDAGQERKRKLHPVMGVKLQFREEVGAGNAQKCSCAESQHFSADSADGAGERPLPVSLPRQFGMGWSWAEQLLGSRQQRSGARHGNRRGDCSRGYSG